MNMHKGFDQCKDELGQKFLFDQRVRIPRRVSYVEFLEESRRVWEKVITSCI